MAKFNNILFTFTLLLLCLNIILANNKAKTKDQKFKEGEKDDEKLEADDSKKNKTKHLKMEEYSKNAHLRPTKCQGKNFYCAADFTLAACCLSIYYFQQTLRSVSIDKIY